MIAKYKPAVSPTVQNGDTFPEVEGGWQHKRGATVLGTYLRANMTRTVLTAAFFINGSTPFAFYREENMPGRIVTLVNVAANTTTGELRFDFSNGNQRTFSSLENALISTQHLDTDDQMCENALILKTLRNSPDGTNLENMIGASMSADFNASVPLVLTEPV